MKNRPELLSAVLNNTTVKAVVENRIQPMLAAVVGAEKAIEMTTPAGAVQTPDGPSMVPTPKPKAKPNDWGSEGSEYKEGMQADGGDNSYGFNSNMDTTILASTGGDLSNTFLGVDQSKLEEQVRAGMKEAQEQMQKAAPSPALDNDVSSGPSAAPA